MKKRKKKPARRRPPADVRPWTLVRSAPVADHRIFRIRQDVLRSPRTGGAHPFVVLEGNDWVNVIATTPDDRVVLIRQYRFGVRRSTLEIPGGIVDDGETPAEAAARELLEETGYAGDPPIELGMIHPNPAIQANATWSYWIRNARRVAAASVEITEDILTLTRPLSAVPRLIAKGEVTHALVVVAFAWLWLRENMVSGASPRAATRRRSRSGRTRRRSSR